MLLKSDIRRIAELQALVISTTDTGIPRESIQDLSLPKKHVLIITGIRRCGKSTLMFQLIHSKYPEAFYLNFDDNRLYGFENNDFNRLDEIIDESGKKILFFDEIQVVEGWERYVRQKLDENFRIIITGSNASLLSKELGTKLTGRHISKELFPFSFNEFMKIGNTEGNEDSVLDYMLKGGFPEYLISKHDEILSALFDDILVRDIVVRFGIRDIKSLQRLALFLISNTGKPVTGSKLKQSVGISATSTILEYFSHFESAYLFYLVPRFSYSVKSQLVNPRKVYSADTGLINVNSVSGSDDTGRKLENMVFNYLRTVNKNISYWKEKYECDFIVCSRGRKILIIQACAELNRDNLDREMNGIIEAAGFFNLKKGLIVTLNQSDYFTLKGIGIKVVPAWEFLSGRTG